LLTCFGNFRVGKTQKNEKGSEKKEVQRFTGWGFRKTGKGGGSAIRSRSFYISVSRGKHLMEGQEETESCFSVSDSTWGGKKWVPARMDCGKKLKSGGYTRRERRIRGKSRVSTSSMKSGKGGGQGRGTGMIKEKKLAVRRSQNDDEKVDTKRVRKRQ